MPNLSEFRQAGSHYFVMFCFLAREIQMYCRALKKTAQYVLIPRCSRVLLQSVHQRATVGFRFSTPRTASALCSETCYLREDVV